MLVELSDLEFKKILETRVKKDKLASHLNGLLSTIANDSQELLEFIKIKFPSFTNHGLQHSWTVAQRAAAVLSPKAKQNLTSMEIFILIMAAAFHDVGMVDASDEPFNIIRSKHHERSVIILEEYMKMRLTSLQEYIPRLIRHIGFVMEAHGLSWQAMIKRPEFNMVDSIGDQVVRINVLSILLRVGDLLDTDSNRSSLVARNLFPAFFSDNESKIHHTRHQSLKRFLYNHTDIAIEVEASTKEEHILWDKWLIFLREEVEKANTYVFSGALDIFHLPAPDIQVKKVPGAAYDLWQLRFELDEKGHLWDVISQSVYTGRFDFIRELIQNAIDAELYRLYLNEETVFLGHSPRFWKNNNYLPCVLIAYSSKSSIIHVIDDGIGMTDSQLENFLFKVASTGKIESDFPRAFSFPSIAKFGIGFISILTRASEVVLRTRSIQYGENSDKSRSVTITNNLRDALVEFREKTIPGTHVIVKTKDRFGADEIDTYLATTFCHTSARFSWLDLDKCIVTKQTYPTDKIATYIERLMPDGAETFSINHYSISDMLDSFSSAIKDLVDSTKLEKRDTNHLHCLREAKNQFLNDWDNPLPVFTYLTNDFSVKKQAFIDDVILTSSDIGILWIPVLLIDKMLGIEWKSVHAFAVCAKKVDVNIYIVNGELFKNIQPISGVEWELEKFGEDLFEKFKVQEEKEEDLLDIIEYGHSYGRNHERTDKIDVDILRLSKTDVQVFRSCPYDGHLVNVNRSHDSSLLTASDIIETPDENSNTEEDPFTPITLFLINKEHFIYQDGIRLPVGASDLVPFGLCVGEANFSGDSRFTLNVARNAIDESSELLNDWFCRVGKTIQEHVIEELQKACEKMDLYVSNDIRSVVTNVEQNNNYITDLALKNATSLFNEKIRM